MLSIRMLIYEQACRQDVAERGGTFLKYSIGCMQQPVGQTWNGAAGHHWSPRRPCLWDDTHLNALQNRPAGTVLVTHVLLYLIDPVATMGQSPPTKKPDL